MNKTMKHDLKIRLKTSRVVHEMGSVASNELCELFPIMPAFDSKVNMENVLKGDKR